MSAQAPIRVLVVDDSALMRKVISRMIASDPALTVIDTARDGADALAKAKKLRPDVMTLDVEMPVMDGLTALRRIRAECPPPQPAILMCSSLTSRGSHESLAALLRRGGCHRQRGRCSDGRARRDARRAGRQDQGG